MVAELRRRREFLKAARYILFGSSVLIVNFGIDHSYFCPPIVVAELPGRSERRISAEVLYYRFWSFDGTCELSILVVSFHHILCRVCNWWLS